MIRYSKFTTHAQARVYVYAQTKRNTHIYIYIHKYIHTYQRTYVVHTYIHAHFHTYEMYVCAICVHMYTCMHVLTLLYIIYHQSD